MVFDKEEVGIIKTPDNTAVCRLVSVTKRI